MSTIYKMEQYRTAGCDPCTHNPLEKTFNSCKSGSIRKFTYFPQSTFNPQLVPDITLSILGYFSLCCYCKSILFLRK